MEITDKLIEHLEALAHIELGSEERADCRRDFEKIITYMDTLSALESGVTLDAVNVCADCAVDALLELTGERASEAVVSEVFSQFCVGK